jgi:hypothetical protein
MGKWAAAVLLLPVAAAAQARPHAVALLVTPHGQGTTTLHLQPLDAEELTAPAATLAHSPGAPIRGALLPGRSQVAVVTDLHRPRDLSFSGTLVLLEPGQAPAMLVDRVAHATAPHVTLDGRLLVQRGRPGPDNPSGRVDELTVDEVDPRTGRARTVARFRGFTAFIAGSLGDLLLLYRVGPRGADVAAVNVRTGALRVLAALPAFARDFSVDPKRHALVFTNRHPTDARLWQVVRLPLREGPAEVLAEVASSSALPFAWPDGAVTVNLRGQPGLQPLGTEPSAASARGPLTPGLQTVRAVTPRGEYAVLLQSPPGGGEARRPWLWDAARGVARPLPAPEAARVEVAGMWVAGER